MVQVADELSTSRVTETLRILPSDADEGTVMQVPAHEDEWLELPAAAGEIIPGSDKVALNLVHQQYASPYAHATGSVAWQSRRVESEYPTCEEGHAGCSRVALGSSATKGLASGATNGTPGSRVG